MLDRDSLNLETNCHRFGRVVKFNEGVDIGGGGGGGGHDPRAQVYFLVRTVMMTEFNYPADALEIEDVENFIVTAALQIVTQYKPHEINLEIVTSFLAEYDSFYDYAEFMRRKNHHL